MAEWTKQGGPWLGAVRSWMQWNCLNGSEVTWGSDEILRCKYNLTPRLLEEIAQRVVEAQFPEVDEMKLKIESLKKKLLYAQIEKESLERQLANVSCESLSDNTISQHEEDEIWYDSMEKK